MSYGTATYGSVTYGGLAIALGLEAPPVIPQEDRLHLATRVDVVSGRSTTTLSSSQTTVASNGRTGAEIY